jgi:branched-chain amino acid transport system ATP-binding protein
MLKLANVHAFYGKSHVLHGVNFEVGDGEIVSLLGRNGSGRSTTVKTIMGLVDGTGSIRWRDGELIGRKAFEIAHTGIGYVPENRDIFPTLTVHQNLMLGEKRGRRRRAGASTTCTGCSRGCTSASTPRPACFPAASSRC